jgi:hypothetical protein
MQNIYAYDLSNKLVLIQHNIVVLAHWSVYDFVMYY